MKRINVVLLAGAMVLLSGAAVASSAALSASKPKVMAVLVEVDAHGHVTRVLPSIELSPRFQRLLEKDLGGWIARPAVINGHAVASQMIVDVAMQATPRKDGNYDANFVYVSSLPSPFGGAAAHWVWSHNDNQLALVSGSGIGRHELPMVEPLAPSAPAWSSAASAPSQTTERIASSTASTSTRSASSTSSAPPHNH